MVISVTDEARQRSAERVVRTQRAGIAAETQRSYDAAGAQWSSWAERAGISPESTSPAHVVGWCQDMAESGLRTTTIRTRVAALRGWHRQAGRSMPDPSHPSCQPLSLWLRGRQRLTADAPRQVAGIRWGDADRICEIAAGEATLAGLRDAAAVAIMSDGLLRISEALCLTVDDVGIRAMTVTRSKTQLEPVELPIGPPTSERVQAWRSAAIAAEIDMDPGSGALLRSVAGGRTFGQDWNAEGLRSMIRRRAEAIGILGASGHSLRIGAAQSMLVAGATTLELQQAGRWASERMPAAYTRVVDLDRSPIMRLRYGATVVPPTRRGTNGHDRVGLAGQS